MGMKVTIEIDDARTELKCGGLPWTEMLDVQIAALQACYGYLTHAVIAGYVYETFGYELMAAEEKAAKTTQKKPTTKKVKKK